MTDAEIRALNASLGFPEASAERWLHDVRADKRRRGPDEALKPQVRRFEDTFSCWEVIRDQFFGGKRK